jgi:hypothetical protein
MNVHKNARLTSAGRELLGRRVSQGWTAQAAAEAAGVSLRTARKWIGRHRQGGERRHHETSSAPRRCPRKIPAEGVARIEALRRQRMTSPAIAQAPGMARSTVGLVLRRLGLGRLAALEPKVPRGPLRAQSSRRDDPWTSRSWAASTRRATASLATQLGRSRRAGWDFPHVCVDDASRLAYTEILPSEGRHDTTALLERALAWLGRNGVSVERVMTDNGSAYRSKLFAMGLAQGRGPPRPHPALHPAH